MRAPIVELTDAQADEIIARLAPGWRERLYCDDAFLADVVLRIMQSRVDFGTRRAKTNA